MALLDTHKAIKEFIAAGIDEKHAEVITNVFSRIDDQVASKSDMRDLKQYMSHDISKVEEKVSKVEEKVSQIQQELVLIKNDILWSKGLMFLILSNGKL